MVITEFTIRDITDKDGERIAAELSTLLDQQILCQFPHRGWKKVHYFDIFEGASNYACFKAITDKSIDYKLVEKLIFKLKLTYANIQITEIRGDENYAEIHQIL